MWKKFFNRPLQSQMKKFTAILFDFDETLVCSRPAYYAAYRHIIDPFQLELAAADDLFRQIWHRVVSPQQALATLDAARTNELLSAFDRHYHENHLSAVTAYPAVVETLKELHAAGLKLGIISLKPRRSGEKELVSCGLSGFFDLVIWGDDVKAPKPAPEACHRAMVELALGNHEILLCGDSPEDIQMGRAAEIATVGALWGDTSAEKLIAAQPDYLINRPAELLEIR